MIKTIVDAETGRPKWTLSGDAAQVSQNVPAGCLAVEGTKGGDWWDGEAWRKKPEAPSKHHTWDWSAHAWVDARSDEQKAADAAAELEAARTAKIAEINAALDAALSDYTGEYPGSEQATWDTQKAESAEWEAAAEADRNADLVPWCAACASARGEDLDAFMTKLAEKISAYRTASAAFVGKRQKLVKEVEAAATADEVNAISWE
jgi:ABC-type Zn2+ transport system substrate-binding protein/surface adhesin